MTQTPEWAARHSYWWHSNPRSKTRSKTLYDKCIVRPKLRLAWDIVRTSTDEHDVEDAWKTIHRLDQKYNGSDNANMLGGRIVQRACDKILIERMDPVQAITEANMAFMEYIPRDWDDGVDAAKWSQYQTELEGVITTAVEGLRHAMADQVQIIGETEIYGCLPGNELGHKNLPDYVGVGDLKTKWSRRNARSKSGFASASLPKDLSGPFEMNNVYQVAGGWALNNRRPVWLLYANKTDYVLFNENNCEQLTPQFMEGVVDDIRIQHRTTEALLKVSDTTEELMSLVSPEWTELCWNEPEGYLQEAKQIWRI